MNSEIEKPPLQGVISSIDSAESLRLGAVSPRNVWTEGRSRSKDDRIVFARWRRGFLLVCGGAVLLLGAVAAITDRSGTATSTATTANPAIAAAESVRRLH